MIVSKTPIRISLGAGGTDLPAYYSRNGAKFATASGSKYTYVMVNHHPEKVVWMGLHNAERVNSPEELKHRVVSRVLSWMDIRKNIEVVSISDVLPNSGLGTSSSFIVGLLNALHAFRGEYKWPEELAQEACYVERILLGENTGVQDQYAAALGGILWLEVTKRGKVAVSRLNLNPDITKELNDRVAFFSTGIQRPSSRIQNWHHKVSDNSSTIETLKKIQDVAISIRPALENGKIDEFGQLLNLHWKLKRELSTAISNSWLDKVYNIGLRSGAIGGNLMGAGGGGYFLFVCHDKESKIELGKTLAKNGLDPTNMHFEMQGSSLIRIS